MKMLELGCGDNARPIPGITEYVGIDCSKAASAATHVVKLGWEPIPFPDAYFDHVLGDQFLEHIPRQGYRLVQTPGGGGPEIVEFHPHLELMNEVWRVAKPGAEVRFHVPVWNSEEQWQDPTHLNPVPPKFWVYFDPSDPWDLKEAYGIKASFTLKGHERIGWYDVFVLRREL